MTTHAPRTTAPTGERHPAQTATWVDLMNRTHVLQSSPDDTEQEFLQAVFEGTGPWTVNYNGVSGRLTGDKRHVEFHPA